MFDFGSTIRNEGGTKGKNGKGLVSFDRFPKKDVFYFYKANWSNEPFIHICEKHFVNRDKEKINIRIYSNLSKLSLNVNGVKVGTITGNTVFLFENVPLQSGQNIVKAYNDNYEDQSTFTKVDQPDPSYIFVDANPEINVKNWFTQEQGEIDLFPENYYSIMDSLQALMENEEEIKAQIAGGANAFVLINECSKRFASKS